MRLIDLSQEIFEGMSVFPMHQNTFIMTNMTHEENMRKTGSKTLGFSARNLLISEHCGTHTDAIWEFEPKGKTIDEAWNLTNSAVAEALDGLPPIKMHCSVLAEEAIHTALNDYRARHGMEVIPMKHHDHDHTVI